MTRWLWIAVLTAITIGGIAWGLRDQPTPVETAQAALGPLRVTVEEEGKTRLRSRYVISAPVAGFMRRLPFKAGDVIRSGQVITTLSPVGTAILDPRTRDETSARVDSAQAGLQVSEARTRAAEARIRTSEEQVKAAQVDVDHWQRQLAREQKLSASGDIPAERVDDTRTALARAQANLAAMEKAVESARRDAETAAREVGAAQAQIAATRATLRPPSARAPSGSASVPVLAPTSGRVIRVLQESEGVVAPGAPLIEIGDANAIEVQVEVLSPDAVQIKPGTPVAFNGWGGSTTLTGQVRVIEPGGFTKVSALGVEEQRVRVIADITSPESEWKTLADGYRVEASFILWESPSVLQIPANALFRYDGGWAVFAIENNTAHRRKVEVGHRTGLAAEILSGLKTTDTVVAHPDETVEDGKLVKAS
jgi:HlyD family secretion protein